MTPGHKNCRPDNRDLSLFYSSLDTTPLHKLKYNSLRLNRLGRVSQLGIHFLKELMPFYGENRSETKHVLTGAFSHLGNVGGLIWSRAMSRHAICDMIRHDVTWCEGSPDTVYTA